MVTLPRSFGAFFVGVVFSLQIAVVTASGIFNCAGGSVQIVAHPDDDLLFQSPTLWDDFDNNDCTTSIFLTSGDAGSGLGYAKSRETGNAAAYAYMASDPNATWTALYATFGGQPVLVETLLSAPQVQRVFFRLPDGQMDGSGISATGFQSLRKLYFGSISTINSIDGRATFSLATLRQALGQILTARAPNTIRTLDYMSDYDSGDHADHYTSARLAAEAKEAYAGSAALAGYMGYPIQNLAPTMSTSSEDFARKTGAFFAYTPYDSAECQSFAACVGRGEYYWLQREYVVTSELATTSSDGQANNPAVLPSGENVARLATATASSYYSYGGIAQPPSAAIDGIKGGYPGNDSVEWSSAGEGAGAWLKLTWPAKVRIGGIVLYDRPNDVDWLKEGYLTFDDGSTLPFSLPYNDGSANVLSLPQNYTTSTLLMTVTSVAAGTSNVGLSEIEVYGQVVGSSSTTTSSPTGPTATPGQPANLALGAKASASSYAAATDQGAAKAIDGVISGYKADGTGDYTKEWATDHQGVGATLSLSWGTPITLNQLVLYDRPNEDDQIMNASISFSDGSTVYSGTLDNAGGATYVNFAARTINSLVLTVTRVSSTTVSVGLAELQAFLVASAGTTSPASSTTTTSTRATVSFLSTSTSTASTSSAAPTATGLYNFAQHTDGYDASSWAAATNQGPEKAIDGVISGYKEDGTGDYTKEWATDHQGVGAWIGLSFGVQPVTINQLVLYDRPNPNDQLTGATVSFSDGSSINIGPLDNAGGPTVFNFSPRAVDSMFITVTSVSSTTTSVGLSEIQVYYIAPASSTSSPTTIASTSSPSRVSTSTSSSTRSTPSSSRSTVSFSSSTTVRSTSSTTTSSSAASPTSTGLYNYALHIDAYDASSWASATDQGPGKAVDGVVDGYKADGTGDYTKEWATAGQTTGAWISLSWPQAITINQLVLHDRLNLDDQVTGAKVLFSDGSSVMVGALVNDGGATYVNFTARTIDSMMFTVTSVSASTQNVGLSEIEVYNNPKALLVLGLLRRFHSGKTRPLQLDKHKSSIFLCLDFHHEVSLVILNFINALRAFLLERNIDY
ncbi:hypothetical protein JCM11251_002303 [Rhodosporidiobolus azoricus]